MRNIGIDLNARSIRAFRSGYEVGVGKSAQLVALAV